MSDQTEQIRRIGYFESLLNEAKEVLDGYERSLELFLAIQDKIRELNSYYGSKEWRRDFEASEKGRLPKDLPCGVLSEDGIDHLLENNRELIEETIRGAGSLGQE